MQTAKAFFNNAWPYQKDKMNLPVKSLSDSLPFYPNVLGFQLVSTNHAPHPSATLRRDDVEIGLVESGGDPTQDGCFIEVDHVELH